MSGYYGYGNNRVTGGGSRISYSLGWLKNTPTNLFNTYTPGAGNQVGGVASNPGLRRALKRRATLPRGTMEKPAPRPFCCPPELQRRPRWIVFN